MTEGKAVPFLDGLQILISFQNKTFMALKIRMQRGGKTHSPRYRLVVAESSSPRDGKFVEILGNYNPQARKNEKEYDLNLERIDHWLSVGAKPSDTARSIINQVRRGATEGEAATPVKEEKPAPAAPAPEKEASPKETATGAEESAPESKTGEVAEASAEESTEEDSEAKMDA